MKFYIPEKYRDYFESGQMYGAPHMRYSLMLYNYKDCKKLFQYLKNLYDTKNTAQAQFFWRHNKVNTTKINYNQEEEIALPQLISSKVFFEGWPQKDPYYPKFEKKNLGLFVYWEEYLNNEDNK